jgi:hypothetical protein
MLGIALAYGARVPRGGKNKIQEEGEGGGGGGD